MSEFLVSVAIPTYNRQRYAASTIRQVYSLGDEIQVVISDNSSDNSLYDKISDICDDNRIKYIYTQDKLAVVENYNIAAQNADGKFFISIGDDDIVLKSVIDLAKWMDRNRVDAVRTSRVSVYSWPSKDKISSGLLSLGPFTGKMRVVNPYEAVVNTLKMGCQSYMELDMIGTYHELVSKELMDRAYAVSGFYYSGFSPDIYSAAVLSLVPNIKAYNMDYPVSIPGFCPDSATFRGKKGIAVSTVEQAIKAFSRPDFIWDSRIPRFYMPQTTWAISMLQAMKDMNRDDLTDKYFNKAYLINACCNYYGGIYKETLMEFLTDDEKELIGTDMDTSFTENDRSFSGAFARKISTAFHLIRKDKYRMTNIENSQIAADLANKFLNTAIMRERVGYLFSSN